MRTVNFICATVFMFAGTAGMFASLFWKWAPPAWVISAVAFAAMMGASAECVVRNSKK